MTFSGPSTSLRQQRFYSAYGLDISSMIELPELTVPSKPGAPHLSVLLGDLPGEARQGLTQAGPFLWAREQTLLIEVAGVARYLVRDGAEIIVDPAPDADDDSVRLFLLGSCLGAALMQRGHLVLHGNAIQVDDKCLVCLGHSGSGKSTLAAGFHRLGYKVLADDVVALDAHNRVLPGIPRLKLWHDAVQQLGIDTSTLKRVRPGMQKFSVPLEADFPRDPVPLEWAYVLQEANHTAVKIEPLTGLSKFVPLQVNSYRARFLEGMGLQAQHLLQCCELGKQIKLAALARGRQGFNLEQDVNELLRHMLRDS